jgi:acyl carrier protein
MSTDQILAQLNEVFRDVLDDEKVVLKPETTADDVEGWDSLNNIQLVVATEKKFKIRFTATEIQGFQNVGEMCEAIAKKIG